MQTITKTTCPYCGVGCGVEVHHTPEGTFSVEGDRTHPANLGRLCSKGSALIETLGLEGRLLRPRVRGRETSWDQALDAVASRFRQVIDEHGPDAVAFYVSGQLLTEDYYVANKLMKGFIGSANIDTNSRLCMASSVAGHKRAFGSDTVPGCYEDLELADLVVLTGSNAAWCHPVLYQRLSKARKARPTMRVVVIDPRRTPSCDIADLHLPVLPGTDGVLFNGLLSWLWEAGCMDEAFVSDHTEGLEQALHMARWYAPSPQAVALHCGLSEEAVQGLFRWFTSNERVVTIYSQGINQSSSGTDKVNAIINCHLLTGRIGKPGSGPFSLTGQPNAMGGREVGALSNQLAAHMELGNEAHTRLIRRFWSAPRVAESPGLKAMELFGAVERGEVKALWIMATNPVVSMPDANRVRRVLSKCEFLVVSDCEASTDTTVFADVLLPAQAWGEKNGTVTNSERRISRQRPFLTSPREARPDWWIVSALARRLGFSGFEYRGPDEIFDEYAHLSGYENRGKRDFDISGLANLGADYDTLEPVQWPVPAGTEQGTARMFVQGGFFTENKRARFIPIIPRPPATATDGDYPLALNTGRIRDQWHTMTRTGKSPRLSSHICEPYIDLHPTDASSMGLQDGDLAGVGSRWGEAILRVRVTERQREGQVFAPMHWNDQFANCARVNSLVNPLVDPISGQPEFKHTPVRVVAYRPAWHGFLLSRRKLIPDQTRYWSRARRYGLWYYEVTGDEPPGNWFEYVRTLLYQPDCSEEWSEMLDNAQGHYRAGRFVSAALESCIFVGPAPLLPEREWLIKLFRKDRLDSRERNRVLAGTPAPGLEDAGRIVCACFGVGRNSLVKAIVEQGLNTPERIGETLQAGTNCGSCIPELRELISAIKTKKVA